MCNQAGCGFIAFTHNQVDYLSNVLLKPLYGANANGKTFHRE